VLPRIRDRNIWLIYLSILLLGLAYGLAIALVAIFLDEHHFSKTEIGTLAAWFALGIVALSLPMGVAIRRLSAKATLTLSLAGYALTVAVFPFLRSYAAIAAIRFFDGAFSVGIWIGCETILLARASPRDRAFVTSLYAIAMAIGYVVGPLTARALVAIAPMEIAFLVSGAIALAASAIVASRLDPDPPGLHADRSPSDEVEHGGRDPSHRASARSTRAILWRIKTSCFATFAYGYFQASVVLFLPLYLIHEKHFERSRTIVIPAFFAAGMLVCASVAGRLGDRFGHLASMRLLGLIGAATIAGFTILDSYAAMCVAVFVAGATLASISPLSLALQGVVVDAAELSRSNAIYNACYALGMLVGPPISSLVFEEHGGAPMLLHLAGLWAAFVTFAWWFAADDPAARMPQRPSAARAP